MGTAPWVCEGMYGVQKGKNFCLREILCASVQIMRIGCSGRAYFNYFTYPPRRWHSSSTTPARYFVLVMRRKVMFSNRGSKNIYQSIKYNNNIYKNNKLFLKHLHTWYESNINRHPVSCFLSNNPVILTVSSDQKLCKTLVVKNRCFVFVYLSKFLNYI